MASSIASRPLVLAFSLLFLLPVSLAHWQHHHPQLHHPRSHRNYRRGQVSYHGGGILTGDVNLVLIWYGQFEQSTKDTVRAFIESIDSGHGGHSKATVANWWNTVQSYQTAAWPRSQRRTSSVRVVREVSEAPFLGKVLTMDYVPILVNKAVAGAPNTVAVLFTAKDVAMHGLCTGKCQLHGMLQKTQPYIIVGDSEFECPGSCVWPFHASEYMPNGVVLQPPNGDAAADSMVVHLAGGLAELITNPYNTGFYGGSPYKPIEVTGGVCKNVFGSRAAPAFGRPGTVGYANGKAFNAHGKNGRNFLLPALWNPKTRSCSTLM